jgi:hypothetical protein
MVFMARIRTSWLSGFLLLALTAAPSRAADLDKYLPADTETIMTFNVKQLLDSAVVKKFGVLEQAKEALKNMDEVGEVLKDLGFDPFKDLDQIIVAGPGGNEKDKGLIIVHGKFDVDKFKKKAEEAAKDHADTIKVHKSGANQIYEVKVPGDQDVTLFVTLASKDTILASPGKDYVVDALKLEGKKENAGLKNKQIQGLIEKMDTKQTLSIAMIGEAFAKAELPDELKAAKATLAKIDAVSGGITVSDEVALDIGITTKTADDAKEMSKSINDGLNQILVVMGLAVGNEPGLASVMDFLKTIKAVPKDKSVFIKARIDADAIDKLREKQKKDF